VHLVIGDHVMLQRRRPRRCVSKTEEVPLVSETSGAEPAL